MEKGKCILSTEIYAFLALDPRKIALMKNNSRWQSLLGDI